MEQKEEQQSVDHSQSNRILQSHSISHICCHGNSHCCYIEYHVDQKSFTRVVHSSPFEADMCSRAEDEE